MVIKNELQNLDIKYTTIGLGEVELLDILSSDIYNILQNNLQKSGFEIIQHKKLILIEKIKGIIIEMIHYKDEFPNINFSNYLSEKLNYHYTYLANVFSELLGHTIEHYIIAQKIEKVKYMIEYKNLNLKEIAYAMNYSSIGHLSNQFKKITGVRPSKYKLKNKSK